MKLHIGDPVTIHVENSTLTLKVIVEDASKGDIIQAKVDHISDEAANRAAVFAYEIGKIYSFARKDIA